MDFKDILSQISAGGTNVFGNINFNDIHDNDIHDNENVYLTTTPQAEAASKKRQPPEFRFTESQLSIIAEAERRGYISSLHDGGYEWLSSKALLAYFLGRLCSGDYPRSDGSRHIVWQKGDDAFPETALNALFGCSDLSNTRTKRLGGNPPKGYRNIDNLFE